MEKQAATSNTLEIGGSHKAGFTNPGRLSDAIFGVA